jgi:hypothetical protein
MIDAGLSPVTSFCAEPSAWMIGKFSSRRSGGSLT